MKRSVNQKIKAVRSAMKKAGIDAYLIPSSDPHQSEYVNQHWKSREWFSGFTGSAGLLVVTQEHAGLWTDSRYFLQGETELKGTCIELMKQGVPHAPEHNAWLRDHLPVGAVIGVDGGLFSIGQLQRMERIVSEKNIKVDRQQDLISAIWTDRPDLPNSPIFEHKVKYAGKSRKDKIREIQAEMDKKGAIFHLLTALDDIAWTFNIRGTDVDYNPVVIAFAVIGKEVSYLFIDPQKVPTSLRGSFDKEAVVVKPYEAIDQFLSELPKGKILINPAKVNAHLIQLLDKDQIVKGRSIPTQLKAVKNETEIKHIKKVMLRDGVALLHLYRWLETELKTRKVSEYELAEQLSDFRKAQGYYHGESFPATKRDKRDTNRCLCSPSSLATSTELWAWNGTWCWLFLKCT